jgi:hypothetical protein
MVYVTCPVCERHVYLEEIPARLPVLVPSHAEGGDSNPSSCSGAGRKSSDVWMPRPSAIRTG